MDWMIKFCESLRELTIKIINFKKKRMKLLTNKQQECENSKICYICKEDFEDKCSEDHRHYTGKYRGVHIVYVIWNIVCKKIPIVFHNGSNYDYFIIKEPAEEFK